MKNGQPGVLLVDDRPDNLVALEAVLDPLPCRHVAVNSGEAALKALLQDDFAVVLLDVQMPGMDGFETARMMKARERTRSLPIIFVTAISKEPQHVFRGYSAGAVDYVFKPYDPVVLRSKVGVFLDLDAKSRAAARSEALLRASFDAAPIGMARIDLRGRIAEANQALARLLGRSVPDLRDRSVESLVGPRDVSTVTQLRQAAVDAGGAPGPQREVRLLRRDGAAVPCAMRVSLARTAAGAENLVMQVVDLRERERAEGEHAARRIAERVADRLRVVQGISDAALATLSYDALVRALLERTVDALGVDTAAITFRDGGELVVHQAAREDGAMTYSERRLLREPGSTAIAPPDVLGPGVRSSMVTELVVDGDAIGALFAGTLTRREFTPDDAALFDLAADRAAIGLERARLFAHEHRIAEALQHSLLPARLPVVEGLRTAARYRPAGAGTQVGGDWYDAIVDPQGRLLLLIGDVAGRGIVAASTMGQLRSAARAYALDGHSPGALLERLNAYQLGLGMHGMTTMAAVRLDPGGEVRYAKAGHPPPLIVRADGSAEWLEPTAQPPLGVLDLVRYEEETTSFAAGDVLLLYTDGLIEVRGEMLDQGLDRLRAAATAPDLAGDVEQLSDDVLARTLRDPAVDDDVTLLVVRGHELAAGAFRRNEAGGRLLALGRWPHEVVRAVRVELPAGVRAGAEARRALGAALDGLVTGAELNDLRLLVAEVVNNAVAHGEADTAAVLEIAFAADAIRVEVTNRGNRFELRAPSAPDEAGGFGLVIVDELAARWGVHEDGDVCVWFELDRARP